MSRASVGPTIFETVAVTAGEVCAEPRVEFYQQIDAANVDLKAFTESFYQNICASHLKPVLETLVYLKHETNVWIETTTLLIPGENDSDKELNEMTTWVVNELGPDVPMHFTAFHPDWRMLDTPATPLQTLTRAREIAITNGVRYPYTGNIPDEVGQSSYCHRCHTRLIGRFGYEITFWNLTDSCHCPVCGTVLPGVLESEPGNWGARFVPIRLHDYT